MPPSRAATVVVTDIATSLSVTVTTNERGDYVVTPLNPGVYRVTVTLDGFQTAVVESVEVQVGQSARVDTELRLGAVTESTIVTSGTPLLDTESGTLGHVVTNTQIVNLPLNGRSFYELARLTPGAVLLPGGGNLLRIRANYISGTAVSGVRGSQTTFMLDGVDVTDHHQGGSLIQTSVDALQEFKVQQSAYSAEFSQAGGALNATTKAGSDQLHGSLFDFMRNDAFDARNFFARETEELKRQQFGGTLGGPLLRRRTFFFASYEGMRERQGLVFNNTVPTAAMRAGDFSASTRRIYDPHDPAAVPEQRDSRRRGCRRRRSYFARFVPDPNTPAGTFSWAPVRELDTDQVTVRVDQTLSDRTRIFGRYSWHDQRLERSQRISRARQRAAQHARTERRPEHDQHALRRRSCTTCASATCRRSSRSRPFCREPISTRARACAASRRRRRPGVGGSFPDFSWSGYTAMNGSAFDQRPKTQDLKVWEVSDNVTWITGRHIVKFGGKYRRWAPLFTDSKQYAGQWTFDGSITQNPASPAGTGDAFADFLLGYPRQVVRAFPADTFGGQANYWHGYVQDDFKVSNRLTLNVGLRYEYSPWLSGYRGQLGTFAAGRRRGRLIVASEGDTPDLAAQFAGPSAYALFENRIQTSSQAGLPLSITKTDRAQFGPRVGFAWQPFGERTVVRGGYGLFYEQESSADRVNNNMVPFRLDQTSFNDQSPPVRTMADFFLGTQPDQLRRADDRRGRARAEDGPRSPLQPRHAAGDCAVHSAGSELRRQHRPVPERRHQHQHSRARRRRHPGSPAVPARTAASAISTTRRRTPTIRCRRRSSSARMAGLFYLASYTWSKSITTQNVTAVGGNRGREKALSGFDVPHNVALSAGYELPFGRGRRLLGNANGVVDAVLGGWQIQGIYVWRSGRPFTPTISSDRANTGVGAQRPNRLGSGALDEPTVEVWFDKTAFALPAQFTYGELGRRHPA